jgi:lysophospholipase L1-like esterase
MPLGDSITAGFGSSHGGGYRLPLKREAGNRIDFVGSGHGGAFVDSEHEGHSGYTVDQIRDGIDAWLSQAQPDVVLIHLGINDLDRGDKPSAPTRLAALVDRIHADRPDVDVIVQGLISTTAGLQREAQAFNADVRQVAGGHDFRWVEPPALAAGEMVDGRHPNDEGYERMAQGFYAALPREVRGEAPPGCPPGR